MFYDCTFSTNLKTELSASDRMFKIGLIWSWISGIPTFAAYYQPIPVAIPIYPPIQPLWSPMLRCDDDFNYIPGITSWPYFGVKLSCVCLMFAYRKK